MRWLVGDVHGCAVELDALLQKIRFDPDRDELWCVGDLVNTGPDSLATLRLWRDAGGRGVLGNHDVYALRAFAGDRARRPHDTLDALFAAPDAPELLERLRGLPILVHLVGPADCGEVWLVRAGVHPAWTDLAALARRVNAAPHDDAWLRSPAVSFATRVRCCTADGEMIDHTGPPSDCPAPFRPWDAFYGGSRPIVHGHWARRGFYRNAKTMSLDSGCVYGGRLTAWCQDEDRLVDVPAHGRNR